MSSDKDDHITSPEEYHYAFEAVDNIYRSRSFNKAASTEDKYQLQQTLQLLRRKRLEALADEAQNKNQRLNPSSEPNE